MKTIPTRILLQLSISLILITQINISSAFATTINAVSDTEITEHSWLGGPNSTHGNDPILHAILGQDTGNWETYPVVRFDLTPFAGQTVLGDATVELYLTNNYYSQSSERTVSVHNVLIAWDPATATFNTFGIDPGVQFGSDVGGVLNTQSIIWQSSADNRYVAWTIPGSIIQSWIDHPDTNNGLLFYNRINVDLYDLVFGSLENVNGYVPRLTFNAVPEPASLFLLGSGLAGLAAWWQRFRWMKKQRVD